MEYILIPTESEEEKSFFLRLLEKMQKKNVSTLSQEAIEDILLTEELKIAGKSAEGSLESVISHLSGIASK